MCQNVKETAFHNAFRNMGRAENFSHEGRAALFDYLEQLEADMGEAIELDVIALCCEFSEYASALECLEDCGYDYEPEGDDEDEREADALEWLGDQTFVIEHDSGIVVQEF